MSPSRLPLLNLIALALFVLGVVEVSHGTRQWHSGDKPLDVVFLLLVVLPLTRMAVQPLLMSTVFVVSVFTQSALFGTPQSATLFFGAMVYVFALVTYADLRGQLLMVPLWSLLPIALFAFDGSGPDTIGNVLFILVIWAIVAGAGWSARTYLQGKTSAEREAELARAESAAAVAEERSRIARDLHDVVAHGVSLIVVQAAAGRSLLDRDLAAARASFDTIEASGQQALAELRRMLDVMRDSAEPADVPQPGLSSLDGLVEAARGAGTPVQVNVGPRGGVDAGVSVSAYRIVQEALTNAVKHAPSAPVRLSVETVGDELVVEVRNARSGRSTGVLGSGFGISGMRERAALYGGTLEAGPDSDGWRVVARLRLDPVRQPASR